MFQSLCTLPSPLHLIQQEVANWSQFLTTVGPQAPLPVSVLWPRTLCTSAAEGLASSPTRSCRQPLLHCLCCREIILLGPVERYIDQLTELLGVEGWPLPSIHAIHTWKTTFAGNCVKCKTLSNQRSFNKYKSIFCYWKNERHLQLF